LKRCRFGEDEKKNRNGDAIFGRKEGGKEGRMSRK
jgi:hypothetical protein